MIQNGISIKIFLVRDYEEHSKSEVGDFGQQKQKKSKTKYGK